MMKAEIFIESEIVPTIFRALGVESQENIPRTTVGLVLEGNRMRMSIKAEDIGALRAATNSYLRWADVASKIASGVR